MNGSSRVFSEKLDLAPEHPWTHEIPLSDAHAYYTIEIRDANGATLIRQTEGEYDWAPESEIHVGPQPSYRIPDPEHRTCDDWIQIGTDLELNGKNLQAMDTYKETLRRFPDSFAALKSEGRLLASLLRFEESMPLLEQVHARNTTEPEISYYLGIAYDGVGETRKARTAYEDAQRFAPFRAAAALRLGELLAREGDLNSAERHLSDAVRAAPDDVRAFEEWVAVKNATGETREGNATAQQGLARFPLSYLLREELGDPDLKELANDPIRVLNLAAQYLRLGLHQRALTVLSRSYPPPPPEQMELGALPPEKHPMVAYFRGYCRERLGQSGLADYKTASALPTSYVFPSTGEEFIVLSAAVRADPEDATAHYLLGTLYFSRGLTERALEEWSRARQLNPGIPVLDASLGKAMLYEKHDPENALAAFREGQGSDPANVSIYLGADQALSFLARPAAERVQFLQTYPNLKDAPSSLIFELILNLAEARDFPRAENLFHGRFFPREEGGTNVRQVWVEVELQRVLAFVHDGRCADALSLAEHLGAEVPDLTFTHDGLEPFVQSARTNYLLGTAYAACGRHQDARIKFQAASMKSDPDQVLWAWMAAQKLPGFDEKPWRERLQSALAQTVSRGDLSNDSSSWEYTAGALENALGDPKRADERFQKALLLPDRMLAYHLVRIARAEAAAQAE
jgi:tetratricopeptide (TPR) repeat protein